jgi:hypothetical protein
MNPAAALLADIVLVKRADSKAPCMDHLEWSRTRIVAGWMGIRHIVSTESVVQRFLESRDSPASFFAPYAWMKTLVTEA